MSQELKKKKKFDTFIKNYSNSRKTLFFKSPMQKRLEEGKITSLDDLRDYARQHPKSTTAKVLYRT